MTREEAIEILKDEAYVLYKDDNPYNRQAFDIAIEALKAQLSAKDTTLDDVSTAYENGYQQGKFEALQSQQKTGRWIEQTDTQNDVYYVCSNCKEAFTLIEGTPTYNLYNYCPNCGAKMKSEVTE